MNAIRKRLHEVERKLQAQPDRFPLYYPDPEGVPEGLGRRLLEDAKAQAIALRIRFIFMSFALEIDGHAELAAACRRGILPPEGTRISARARALLKRMAQDLLDHCGLTSSPRLRPPGREPLGLPAERHDGEGG